MKRWTLALRLGVAMAGFTVLAVLAARGLGLLPDPCAAERERRTAVCEALAVHGALAAAREDWPGLDEIVRVVSERNRDIAQVRVERVDGRLVAAQGTAPSGAALTEARVPIYSGPTRWGQVRVQFRDAAGFSLPALVGDPWLRLAVLTGVAGFAVYLAYGYFLARRLLPAGASPLPERVRETLNTFAEGILVIDNEQRIAFANEAFCDLAGQPGDVLEGRGAAELDWLATDGAGTSLPWEDAAKSRHRLRTTIELLGAEELSRSLAVHATPIEDDEGNLYGALATFDDLTTIEQMNARLRTLLEMLKQSRSRIRQQNAELSRLATIDPLTQCLNRRELFARLETEFASARRYRHPLACAMVDLDHFKSINDKLGHAKGDEALVRAAETLRLALRESDLAGRYGGEEFCVLLPHTDLAGARTWAERLRRSIANLAIDDVTLTVSVGVSSVSLGAATAEQLVEQADVALYAAKRAGRNRVVQFDEIREVEADATTTRAWGVDR
jgi:diguanylate cyclase (GGDEF)-like protein/PAS domain S-box-containing protein